MAARAAASPRFGAPALARPAESWSGAAPMSPRARWSLIAFALIALVAAGALTYGLTIPSIPPLPRDEVKARRAPRAPVEANVMDGAGLAPAVQSELDCVDRLLRNGPPAGADPQEEWERCAQRTEAGRNAAEARAAEERALDLGRPPAGRAANGLGKER